MLYKLDLVQFCLKFKALYCFKKKFLLHPINKPKLLKKEANIFVIFQVCCSCAHCQDCGSTDVTDLLSNFLLCLKCLKTRLQNKFCSVCEKEDATLKMKVDTV